MLIFATRLRALTIAMIVGALATVGAAAVPGVAHADWVRNDQWQLGALNAAAAWQQATGLGTIVAVLDSGVDADHVDLKGQVLPGTDLVDGTTDGRIDPVGHGTTVASLIAGRRDEAGVAGLAPNAKILPIRVLNSQNRYEDASVVATGIRWATDHGARVINLSLGGLAYSDVLADALRYAADHDIVVVACTGNLAPASGETPIWYPAREPGVVAVAGLRGPAGVPGATWLDQATESTPDEALWPGSLTGSQTVLTAPAANLLGARPGGYWRVQGTSFAAPLVAGAAALVRSRFPQLSAPNVINRLISTANDLGTAGRDDRYGYGLVNPLAALTAEVETVRSNPLAGVSEQGRLSEADPSTPAEGAAPDAGPGQRTGPGDDTAGDDTAGGGPDGSAVPHGAPGQRRAGAAGGASSTPPVVLGVLILMTVLGMVLGRGRHAGWRRPPLRASIPPPGTPPPDRPTTHHPEL